MKYYPIAFLFVLLISCQIEKNEVQTTLTPFSKSEEYDDFSKYEPVLIDNAGEKNYDYSISFVGESSQNEYFRFDEAVQFKPFIIDSLHHWIPVTSHSTLHVDSSLFDFKVNPFAGFSKWTSKDHWSRVKDPELVNELILQTSIHLTNSKFAHQSESKEEGTSSIPLESPGDIFSISINHTYTSDTLLLNSTLSGNETFIEYLSRHYGIDEEVMVKFTDEML